MMRQRATRLAFLCGLLVLCASASASAQQFDIGSGGLPTVTGGRGASVIGSNDVTQNLVVNVDFGEVSPINTNNVVKVIVPISIRSTSAYQVSVSAAGTFDSDPQAVQRADIGFGANNLRPLGPQARQCNDSAHAFRAPFNNDPAAGGALDANGRAAYASSLANLGASAVILSGPELTKGNTVTRREPDNGYVFDAVFAIRPQFYAPGRFSATLTFTISQGPNTRC